MADFLRKDDNNINGIILERYAITKKRDPIG
jgi:hypothetical protein